MDWETIEKKIPNIVKELRSKSKDGMIMSADIKPYLKESFELGYKLKEYETIH